MAPQIILPPFPSDTFRLRMSGWFKPVTVCESGIVLFPVRLDRLRRLTQFLRDKKLQESLFPNAAHIRWFPVSVSFFTTVLSKNRFLHQLGILPEEWRNEDLDQFFYEKEKEHQFVIVLTDPEYLYSPEKEWALSIFNDLAYQYRNISVVQLLERNVMHTAYSHYVQEYASLFNHVSYTPLYDRLETAHFTRYLCEYFSMENPFSTSDYGRIYEMCGGHPWLVKEVVRFFLLHPQAKLEQAFHHEELSRMVDIIWQGMMPGERSVIRSISTGGQPTPEDKESYEFLEKVHFIEHLKNKLFCPIKLLSTAARNDGIRQPLVVEGNGVIYSGGVVITDYFTLKERNVLAVLHKKFNTVVPRETVGEAVWGPEGFSDWALDRLMSRIRKKLTKLGYPADYLMTIPNKGFFIRNL